MLELYHNGLSSCSQKVRMVLAEKSLDFESQTVDLVAGGQHDPEYVKLNPNHVVPTLIDEGRVLIESSLINAYLDDAYPDPPQRPTNAADRHAMGLWIKRIDEKVHPSASVLTFSIGARQALLNQPEEVREANIAAIPDPARRAARRSVIENGVKAPEFAGALGRFVDLLDAIQASSGSWLSGPDFGLADAAVLPYVLRLDHLAMTPLIDARPRVAAWYAAVQARPSYTRAVSDWLPEPIVKMFRANGEAVWADVEPLTH